MTTQITIDIDTLTHGRLVDLCRRRAITESQAVEDALLHWLDFEEEMRVGPVDGNPTGSFR